MNDLIHKDECFKIIGACIEVHRRMGSGFLEAVYQECLAEELTLRSIPFRAQRPLEIRYRDKTLSQLYVADFDCFEGILMEIKATSSLVPEHEAQLINYLNATGYRLGILVNFGAHPKLEWKRFVKTRSTLPADTLE